MDAPEALTGAGAIEAAARARAPGLFGELLRRSSWLMLGSALGRALPLLLLVVAGRRLETQQFANASMGFAWSGVAMSLAGAGLAMTLVQRLAAAPAAQQAAVYRHHLRWALLLGTALAAAAVLTGERAALPLFGRAFAPGIVLPAALAGLAWTLCGVAVAALNGAHHARADPRVAGGGRLCRVEQWARFWGGCAACHPSRLWPGSPRRDAAGRGCGHGRQSGVDRAGAQSDRRRGADEQRRFVRARARVGTR